MYSNVFCLKCVWKRSETSGSIHGIYSGVLTCVSPTKIITGTRFLSKTHYEVLELERNCTAKDIRDAFVRLSKQFHPDYNPSDPTRHNRFVRLNEAYSILSRPDLRKNYDVGLVNSDYASRGAWKSRRHADGPGERVTYADESFWYMRDRSQDSKYARRPYYGVNGWKRVSNSKIMIGCIFFVAVGSIVQFYAIVASNRITSEEFDRRDRRIGEMHANVRDQAFKRGNAATLEKFRKTVDEESRVR